MNNLLNISMITRESLRELKNQLGFSKGVNRQYDDQFAKSGAKIGATINIRKPVRYEVSNGPALNIQGVDDQSVALVLDSQKHVGFQFSSKELTLNIDEFRERYIKPAITSLANKIDFDGLAQYKNVFNAVGTPGTQPASQAAALALALAAGRKLDENGAPVDDMRSMCLNPATQAAMVGGLAGLYNQQEAVSKQYEKGRMFDALGFKWKMDQNVNVHTGGVLGGAPVTAAAGGGTNGQLATVSWTAAAAQRMNIGDVFSVEGVNAVNPQSKQSTGSLMQFVVTAAFSTDGAGAGTIQFSPAMVLTGPYQNVDALPGSGADILPLAATGAVSPSNLAYHRDAFVLGMADLQLPDGVDMAARASDPDAGLSLRIVRDYDINTDTWPCRVDVLYGWKTVYPELAVRVQG